MDVLRTLRSTVIVLDGLQSGKSRAQLLIVSRGKWGGHEQGNTLHLLHTNAAAKAHVIACAWCTISSGPHMILWVGGWLGAGVTVHKALVCIVITHQILVIIQCSEGIR